MSKSSLVLSFAAATVLAAGGAALRTAVIAVLTMLRAQRPLPRVWAC